MQRYKKVGQCLFVIYLVALIWILLFKFSISINDLVDQFNNQSRSINLIPFNGSVKINDTIDLSEIINNIIIFIPFGGLLGIIDKRSSFLKKMLFIFTFSLFIEVSQFIFGLGATDVTDILTNVVGGVVGLFIYYLLNKIFKTEKLDKVLIFMGLFLFLVAMSGVLLLFFVN